MSFSAFDPVGEDRIREMTGLWFEDFAVGQVFRHRPGITVYQHDNVQEALGTMNQAMIHFDEKYAAETEFRRPLVVSTLTLQRAIGMAWKTFGRRKRIVGFNSIRMTEPVFGGDTLYVESEIIATSDHGDDPDCGLVSAVMAVQREGTMIAEIRCDMAIYRNPRQNAPPLPGAAASHPPAHPSHIEVSAGHYMETVGIDLKAMAPGLIVEHRPGFVLTWAEARRRSLISGDRAPAAVDREEAAAAGGGRPAISEPWLVSLLTAATTRAFGRVAANLGWENVRFPFPARDRDRVFAESRNS